MKIRLPYQILIVALFSAGAFSTASAQDTLYVGSYNTGQIFRYNSSGVVTYPEPWLGPYSSGPGANGNGATVVGEGIAVGQNYPTTGGYAFGNITNPVYIADLSTGDIEVANANATGMTNPVVNATFISGLSTPSGIALSNNGLDLYVAQQGAGSVTEYNALTGAYITSVTGITDAHDVTVGSDGSVYVTAYSAGVTTDTIGVEKFNANLTGGTTFIAASTSVGPGLLSRATGMVFDAAGNLWVANVYAPGGSVVGSGASTSNFVSEYSSTGTLIRTVESSGVDLYTVFGLSIGPGGNIYAADFNGNAISEINDSTGALSTFISAFPTSTDEPKYAIWSQDAVTYVPESRAYGTISLGLVASLLLFRRFTRTWWGYGLSAIRLS